MLISLFLLFGIAFFAASLLPLGSEWAVIVALEKGHLLWLVWLFATAGNVLGGLLNAWLGRQFLRWQYKPWYPINVQQLQKGQAWFARYGQWSLLLSWVPVIGDPLVVVAGWLKMSYWRIGVWLLAAKGGRYGVLTYLWIVSTS